MCSVYTHSATRVHVHTSHLISLVLLTINRATLGVVTSSSAAYTRAPATPVAPNMVVLQYTYIITPLMHFQLINVHTAKPINVDN